MGNLGLAAVVLAAGASKRFGEGNKLHAEICGKTVIRHVLELVSSHDFSHRLLVANAGDQQTQNLARQFQFTVAINSEAEHGIGTSISCGVDAIERTDIDGIAIFLADMPFILAASVGAVVHEFSQLDGKKIVRPIFQNRAGHPVIFPSRFASRLKELQGDQGASTFMKHYSRETKNLETNDPGTIRDIDLQTDLKKYE